MSGYIRNRDDYEANVLGPSDHIERLIVPSRTLSRTLDSLAYPNGAVPSCLSMYVSSITHEPMLMLEYMYDSGTAVYHDKNEKKSTRGSASADAFRIMVEDRGVRLIPNKEPAFLYFRAKFDYKAMHMALAKWAYQVWAAYDKVGIGIAKVKIEFGLTEFSRSHSILDIYNSVDDNHYYFLYDPARYLSDDAYPFGLCAPESSFIDETDDPADMYEDDGKIRIGRLNLSGLLNTR